MFNTCTAVYNWCVCVCVWQTLLVVAEFQLRKYRVHVSEVCLSVCLSITVSCIIIISLPDICQKALSFPAVLCLQDWGLWSQQMRRCCQSNVYETFGRSPNLIFPFGIFAHPSLVFTGVKKREIWFRFSTHSPLCDPHCKTKPHISNKVQSWVEQLLYVHAKSAAVRSSPSE